MLRKGLVPNDGRHIYKPALLGMRVGQKRESLEMAFIRCSSWSARGKTI